VLPGSQIKFPFKLLFENHHHQVILLLPKTLTPISRENIAILVRLAIGFIRF
jgi:hypothetical protein